MTHTMGIYTSSATTTGTTTALPGPDLELESKFAWIAVTAPAGRRPEIHISDELAAEICEALAAADRGETLDLGSFAQFADDSDDEG